MGKKYRKKSKFITYLLWLFLGFAGGHRFYIGDYFKGTFMLLTFGGCGIWWFFDFFAISSRVYYRNIELKQLASERRAEDFRLENLRRQEELQLQNQIRQEAFRRQEAERRLLERERVEQRKLEELKREQRIRESGIYQIDEMTGEEFEEFLYVLYKGQGYNVQLTPKTGDFGADLILTKNNRKIAIQAKRYKDKVGVGAIQEIHTAKSYYRADECWVVTNNYYTDSAVKLAASSGVVLIDRNKLIGMLVAKNQGA